jgi:protein TonB
MLVLAEHNRAFGYAIAASLALHALVLAVRTPTFRTPVSAAREPALVAHLVDPPPAPVAPAPAPPPVSPPVVQKPEVPKPPPPKRTVRSRPKATPSPITKPAPAKPAPSLPAEQEPRQETAEAPPAAPPAPQAPAPAPSAPSVVAIAPPASPAPDPAALLARFRQDLLAAAVRYKRYPRVAMDNGWTGDVVLRIDVDASGAVTAIRVERSSGHEILDGQALEMFRRAAPDVVVPAALRGKPFSVDVRAIYNLRDRPG